ncbi:MAG: hypothetical protein ACI8ZQ_001873 [Bacteroidia bacterium]|jgi:hypothetical protein
MLNINEEDRFYKIERWEKASPYGTNICIFEKVQYVCRTNTYYYYYDTKI